MLTCKPCTLTVAAAPVCTLALQRRCSGRLRCLLRAARAAPGLSFSCCAAQNHHGGHELWYYKAARVRGGPCRPSVSCRLSKHAACAALSPPGADGRPARPACLSAHFALRPLHVIRRPHRSGRAMLPWCVAPSLGAVPESGRDALTRGVQELADRHWYGLQPKPLAALAGTALEGLVAEHPCEWCAVPARPRAWPEGAGCAGSLGNRARLTREERAPVRHADACMLCAGVAPGPLQPNCAARLSDGLRCCEAGQGAPGRRLQRERAALPAGGLPARAAGLPAGVPAVRAARAQVRPRLRLSRPSTPVCLGY